jgi:SHS2 domain-containing protein
LARPSYRLLPNIALADVAFKANAASPSELFESCARALTDIMVDRRSLRAGETRTLEVKAEGMDGLLYDFLTQLIIMKDVDSLLFKEFDVKVDGRGESLTCELRGEPIDRERHKLRNDVKAVTMYMFGVKREGRRYTATIVLDI